MKTVFMQVPQGAYQKLVRGNSLPDMEEVIYVRHRTDDLAGQRNGRPLTIDNDRADMLILSARPVNDKRHFDHDAHARADHDRWDPLYDPMEVE